MGFAMRRLRLITSDGKVKRWVYYQSAAVFFLIPLIFLLFFLWGEWPESRATAFDFYVRTFVRQG
jgi:hypothetical protein